MIKCNVSVCGTVSKAAVVRKGKDGMQIGRAHV